MLLPRFVLFCFVAEQHICVVLTTNHQYFRTYREREPYFECIINCFVKSFGLDPEGMRTLKSKSQGGEARSRINLYTSHVKRRPRNVTVQLTMNEYKC